MNFFKKIGREISRPFERTFGLDKSNETLNTLQQMHTDYMADLSALTSRIQSIRSKQSLEQSKIDLSLQDFRDKAESLIAEEKKRLDTRTSEALETIKLQQEIMRHGGLKQTFLSRMGRGQPKTLMSK